MNPDEVRKMIAASEKAGKFFTIHQSRRFDPDFRIVKKAIEAGYIGKPYLIESRIESENGNGCMYNWRGMLDHGGGMLPDWGVHILDQMLWFMGKAPVSVYAKVVNLYSEEVDDYSKIILTYEDGTIVQTEVTTYGPVARPRWNIYGDKGAGVMQGMGDGFIKIRRMKQDSFDSHMAPAYRDNEAYDRPQRLHHIQEFEEFNVDGEGTNSDWGSIYKNLKNVLDGKEELFVKPEQVLLCMRVIEAAFISAKENRVVYID
jgi:predicted dehydrogenase